MGEVLQLFSDSRSRPAAGIEPWGALRQSPTQEPAPAAPRLTLDDCLEIGREYQRQDARLVIESLEAGRSALLVMATGLGKTVTAAMIAKWAVHVKGWRVLWIVHRNTLVKQARAELSRFLGEYVSLERAEWRMSNTNVVVGSVQTLKGKRLTAIDPERFQLVITDEGHRSCAKSYGAIYAHFSEARRLGLTATPMRHDRKALGTVYDAQVTGHDFLWGVREGFLVEPEWEVVEASDVDLSAVDLGDLDAVDAEMIKAVAQTADRAAALAGRTLIFTPAVKTAHAVAEALNEKRPGCARAVDGTTDEDTRDAAERGHKDDTFQYLSNCGIYTEGYDDPRLANIVMARPTNSLTVFWQVFGRGGRPLPGIAELPTREERLAAIANSSKPRWRFVDITGKGRRDLITPVDVLGGDFSPDERKRATKLLREKGGSVTEALEKARVDLQRLKKIAAAAAAAKVTSEFRMISAFDTFGVRDPERRLRVASTPNYASQKQVNLLRGKYGIETPDHLTRSQFKLLLTKAMFRESAGLCNFRQIRWLAQFGIDGRQMPVHTGKAIADAYRLGGRVMPGLAVLDAIVAGSQNEAGTAG